MLLLSCPKNATIKNGHPDAVQEGGKVYRCIKCGETGERPVRIYGRTGIDAEVCASCGSEEISGENGKCSICEKTLFKGERAFEAGGMLMCGQCVTEIMI